MQVANPEERRLMELVACPLVACFPVDFRLVKGSIGKARVREMEVFFLR